MSERHVTGACPGARAHGRKGALKVEYVFTSSGKYITGKKEAIDTWNVRRVVSMTAQYSANAPQAFGVLHQDDGKQKAEMATLQAKTMSAAKKLEPMQNDVMAMAAKCGITMDGPNVSAAEEKAQEACMEKAAMEYGNTMEMTPEIKSAGADITAGNKNVGHALSDVAVDLAKRDLFDRRDHLEAGVRDDLHRNQGVQARGDQQRWWRHPGTPGRQAAAGGVDTGSRQHRARHHGEPAHAHDAAADHEDGDHDHDR